MEPCEPESRRRFHTPVGARRQLAFEWGCSNNMASGLGGVGTYAERAPDTAESHSVCDRMDGSEPDMSDFATDGDLWLQELQSEEQIERDCRAR